ncbi:MAG: hypothetical protein QM744_11010 [Mesorhizobium sp.]
MLGDRGDLCGRPFALLHGCKPPAGRLVVPAVQFDADPVAVELLRRCQCGAATAERVQHKLDTRINPRRLSRRPGLKPDWGLAVG